MRFVVGAAIGSLLALLLGVPSFIADRDTKSEPPLFSTYCDLPETFFVERCVPSPSGILSMVLAGAVVGVVCAAPMHRRRPAEGAASAHARSGPSSIQGAGSVDGNRQASGDTRDRVVSEAAQQISAAVERKRDLTVQSLLSAEGPERTTIRRKDAAAYISDTVRSRASHLGIVNLAGTAVDRALETGLLRSQGTGPEALLSRTSRPLELATSPSDHPTTSDHAETAQENPTVHRQEQTASADHASATKRAAPEALEDLENLIRLHERGILTDTQLEAAKSRLLSDDS